MATPALQAAAPDEMRVQAAYVLNFVRYSRWPEPSTGPLVIAVLGTPETAAVLSDSVLRAGAVNRRSITVRLIPLASIAPDGTEATRAVRSAAGTAHVIFVGSSHGSWAGAVVAASAGRPVLTVGPGPGFLRDGGMIGLYLEREKVRFDVNAPAIKASPVDVSARLLVLARPADGT